MSNRSISLFSVALVLLFAGALFSQVQPPRNLTATPMYQGQYASVKLTWQPPVTPVTGLRYALYKKLGGLNDSGAFKKISSGIYGTTFSDNSVQRGKTYSYYVTAYAGTQTSVPSDTEVVTLATLAYAHIYGVVTRDSNGAPLKKAMVQFLPTTATPIECNSVYTDSLGRYSVKLPTGVYAVYFAAQGFVSEYYNNKTSVQTADKITLAANDSTAVNAGLAGYVPPVMYNLSGSVKNAAGAVMKSWVYAYKLRNNTYHWYGASVRTDSLGKFTFKLKQNDTVIVYAKPYDWNYYPEYWNNKRTFAEADRIAMTGNITNIDVVVDPKPVYPNGISGFIKDTLNQAVTGHVSAYRLVNGRTEKKYVMVSDSLGNYAFANLLPGKYILFVMPQNNFRPTYFKYNGTQTTNWRNADSVMVDSAGIVSGINFKVVPRSDSGHARITGTLRGHTRNNLIAGAFIYAYDANMNIVSYAVTDMNGKYVIGELTPGTYTLISDAVDYRQSATTDIQVDYGANSALTVPLSVEPEGVTAVENEGVISGYALEQNYPNPFNPSTTIKYSVAEKTNVRLSVFDALGREIAVLVNGELNTGSYNVDFNASKLASGNYFYKLQAGNVTLTKKLTLLK